MDNKNFRVFWVVLYQEYIQSLKHMDSIHLFFSWHRKELRQKKLQLNEHLRIIIK